MPAVAGGPLAMERMDAIVDSFGANFRVKEKKLSKKQERALLELQLRRDRARLDPLGLCENVEKKRKERRSVNDQVAKHYADLTQRKNEAETFSKLLKGPQY